MSSERWRRCIYVAASFASVLLAPSAAWAGDVGVCASSASGHGVLSSLVQQFQTATAPWATTALAYARSLFFVLVGIEMAWSGVTYVLQKDSLPDFLAALLLKLLSVGFFFILLQPEYGPAWIGAITASFMQAGSAIGGQPTFGPSDPSAVFNCGTDIAGVMMNSLSHRGFTLDLLGVLEAFLTALLCAIGVMFGFSIAAGQLLVTLIESYIVIGAGLFMLGFSGSRWTLVFSEKYLGYVWSVGIKLFMLELIIGLGYGLGQQWAELFSADSVPPGTYIEVLGAALLFGFLVWQIPGLASSLMNGAPRMTLGSFLSNVGTTMVGGAVLTGGIVGAASGATALARKGLETLRQASAAAQGKSETGTSAAPASGNSGSQRSGADFTQSSRARPTIISEADDKPIGDEPSVGDGPDEPDAVPTGDRPGDDPPPDSGGKPRKPGGGFAQGFRTPPIPDDAADGSIHIRFKHPE